MMDLFSRTYPLDQSRWDAGVDENGQVFVKRDGVTVGLTTTLSNRIERGFAAYAFANPEAGIEVYPVGLFLDWKQRKWRSGRRYLVHQVKDRDWRAIRQYFNGFLAEWHYAPAGVKHTVCGRGWTRRRALARLGAHIVASNMVGAR